MNYTAPYILDAERNGSPVSTEPLPLYRCQGCGERVTERFECELCRKKLCMACIFRNVKNTGWNVCLDCLDEKRVEIIEEARDLACARCARTGSHKALHEYVCLRIELNERRTKCAMTK